MKYKGKLFYYKTFNKDNQEQNKVLSIKINDVCLDKLLDFYHDNCVKNEKYLTEIYKDIVFIKEKEFESELEEGYFLENFSDNTRKYIQLFGEDAFVKSFWR